MSHVPDDGSYWMKIKRLMRGVLMMIRPSRHYETRLSLSQLCGVKKKRPPLQLLSSGQCAPNAAWRVSSPHRGHSIEAWLHRGAAMTPSTASQRRPAMVSRWLRPVRLECGCRMRTTTISVSSDAFHKPPEASPSTFSPALMYASIAQASANPGSRLD